MDGDNMQKPEQRKRRRRRLPPTRLAWPGDAICQDGGDGDTNFFKAPSSKVNAGPDAELNKMDASVGKARKKSKRFDPSKSKYSSLNNSPSGDGDGGSHEYPTKDEAMLWVDKHQPTSSKELCVAPKKVKEVKEWLQSSTIALSSYSSSSHKAQHSSNKLLVLVGSPGIGKSTMIKVLANELNLRILEWNDASNEYVFHSNRAARSRGMNMNMGGIAYESQLTSFEEFLNSAAFQYQSCVSMKTNADYGNKHGESDGMSSVVLIDETPNLHTKESAIDFRNVTSRYIEKTMTPTIFIFSEVFEGKHKPEDLERYFDPELLYDPSICTILQINPVTKAKMKSCLKDILKQEGVRMTDITRKSSDDGMLEILHIQSGGDLRHAIMNLQFQMNCGEQSHSADKGGRRAVKGKGNKSANVNARMSHHHQRDSKLSTFHALGKLLYAKRDQDAKASGENHQSVSYHDCEWNKDRRAPLQFDPERVLEQGDIGINGALAFLHYHAVDFFTDISELSSAFDRFSDGAHLMKDSYGASKDSCYPQDYASSLISRTVADANKHPAPSKFRQLTAPMIYEVMRKKQESQIKIEHVYRRLSYRGYHLSMHADNTSSRFVMDDLPYFKKIIPEEVSNFQGKIYRHSSKYVVFDGCDDLVGDEEEGRNKLAVELEQQNAVLAKDDIIDDSSSESENEDAKSIQKLGIVPSSQRSSVVSQDSASPSLDRGDGRGGIIKMRS